MRSRFRFGVLTAAALMAVAGCQGSVNDHTGSGNSGSGGSSGTGGGSSFTGSGGSHPGTGGSASGTGGAGAGTGSGGSGGSGTTGTGGGSACAPLAPIPRRLYRLSAAQWGAAVQTLLNLPAAIVLSNRGSEAPYAFFSDATSEVDSAMQSEMFSKVDKALTTIDSTALAPCTGTTATAQTTCASNFVSTFAQKAYRRPLDASEVTNLMKVYAQGAMQDYKTGINLMVEAILISPSFLDRTELGAPSTPQATGNYPDTTLTPYEIAGQLAFTLLGNLPDDQLMAAAASGTLGTADGIGAQIDRLMAVPAVQANLTNIVLGWFNINQMFGKVKDPALLAGLPASEQDMSGIQNDLYTSTQKFVSSVLWSGSGKIDDLLTSQAVFVNQRLATLFPGITYPDGVKAPTSDSTFVAATWPTSQARSGMLTQPAYLWSASDSAATSIVHRGKAIHDYVLCQDPLGSPVDLTTPSSKLVLACTNPTVPGASPDSSCDSEILQSDARMTYQPCKSCHSQMDPYSRVLQNYGPIGNYRTMDEAGRPIDPTTQFVPNSPLAGTMVTGVPAFAQAMVKSGTFDGCSVQQIASYAIGSTIPTYDTCEIDAVRSQTDGTVKSLVKNILMASFVRTRAGGSK